MRMKKMKIYLDTTAVSYLDQQYSPEKMKDTLAFWEFPKSEDCEVLLSSVTLQEIDRNAEPKRIKLKRFLEQIEYKEIKITEEIAGVANKLIENRTLTPKSFDDCLHIACSLVHDCTCIVSWNFRHIVNMRTIKGVKLVAAQTGYGLVTMICTPSYLMAGEENES
ncbi:MAG: PIN domain-containing protein [Candidatus Bathyarchaeota archaeon]|jgi:predicted nucleic acid-binding protein|nr:PIN domain-containing protein [Candidatus Termitimicrobium sp.]